MSDPSSSPPRRIGYVVKVFPRTSETFIVNEIRALESFGERIELFSLHHGEADVRHQVIQELKAPIRFVEDELPDDEATHRGKRKLTQRFGLSGDFAARALPRKYVRLAVQLAAMVKQRRIDHLHAHFASRSGHVAALAAALAGVPFSLTAHAKDIYHREVDAELLRWKIAAASFVVTVTEYNLRYLRQLVADLPGVADKVVRLYNGVDLQRFRPGEQPVEPPLLLGIGRLIEKKGFPLLIDACRQVRARGARFRCEIIGDGELLPLLQGQLADLDGDVTLRGKLGTEEIAAALRQATALVLPCIAGEDGNVDALPTVLLEAMASGLPVISTAISGIPEIIAPGETGWLVPPGESAPLAEAIVELLEDPARARRFGAAGRERAQVLFDLYRNAGELRRLFDQSLARRAA